MSICDHNKELVRALCALPLIMLLACSAPHDNPLDPENPDYSLASLSGTVRTAGTPHLPVAGAAIWWQPGSSLIHTSAAGTFSLGPCPPASGWLYCSHPDFFSDSLYTELPPAGSKEIEFLLNHHPALTGCNLYSVVLNRYPALRSYQIGIDCRVVDPDGDIDSVRLRQESLGVNALLGYAADAASWQRSFSLQDLRLNAIQQITGLDFAVEVADRSGHRLQVGEARVRRIILDEVSFIEPANAQSVTRTPLLRWQRLAPGFSFTWSIEIYAADLLPLKVYEKTGLSPESTSLQVDAPLEPGEYYWVLWCVDEFSNRARSRPASFVVAQVE